MRYSMLFATSFIVFFTVGVSFNPSVFPSFLSVEITYF